MLGPRPEIDPRSLEGSQSYCDGTAAQAPHGGWKGAAERASSFQHCSTPHFEKDLSSTYVGHEDVLPGCHVDKSVALLMAGWRYDNDTLGKHHYFSG
eukprot:405623-Karenia_brevis.AAC.1